MIIINHWHRLGLKSYHFRWNVNNKDKISTLTLQTSLSNFQHKLRFPWQANTSVTGWKFSLCRCPWNIIIFHNPVSLFETESLAKLVNWIAYNVYVRQHSRTNDMDSRQHFAMPFLYWSSVFSRLPAFYFSSRKFYNLAVQFTLTFIMHSLYMLSLCFTHQIYNYMFKYIHCFSNFPQVSSWYLSNKYRRFFPTIITRLLLSPTFSYKFPLYYYFIISFL